MDNLKVLPFAEVPIEGESFGSLVQRTALRGRFPEPRRLFRPIGFARDDLAALLNSPMPDEAAEGIRTLFDLDAESFRRISPWSAEANRSSVLGHSVTKRFTDFRWKRVCPACLDDSPFHRATWHLRSIQSCHHHSQQLIEICPGCERPIVWRGMFVTRCGNPGCRFDLRHAPSTLDDRPYNQEIAALFEGGPGARLPGADLPPGPAVEVAFMIGCAVQGRTRPGRADSLLRKAPNEAADVMVAGWAALRDWPRGLHAALDTVRSRAPASRRRFGLRHAFGDLAIGLSAAASEPWGASLRAATADYLAGNSDLRTTMAAVRRFGTRDALRREHMTRSEAAEILEVSGETMRLLAERDDLYVSLPTGQAGEPVLVRTAKVRELVEVKAGSLLVGEAIRLLGVGKVAFRALVACGLIREVPEGRRVTGLHAIERASVVDLVAAMRARVVPGGEPADFLSLHLAGRGERTIEEICAAVMDGRLVPRGLRPGALGLNALLFSKTELTKALPRRRTTMSLNDAARALGVGSENLRIWATEGYLLVEKGSFGAEKGRRVTDAEMERFRAAYATGIEIGKLAESTGRWVRERLAFLGHPPLASAAKAGLYRRSVLGPEVLRALGVGVERSGRKESAAAAADVARRVGDAIAAELGKPLRRNWNTFSHEDGTLVQVLVGRRQRFRSKYVFRINDAMRRVLGRAREGWIALALADVGGFTLLPWNGIGERLAEGGGNRHIVYVEADARGTMADPALRAEQRWLLPG